SFPSAADRPMTDLSVSSTIILVPSTVMTDGDAYAGPSPSHFHFVSPLLMSKARTVPLPRPPRCATTMPSTMMGEVAVLKFGQAEPRSLAKSLRHSTLPSSALRQEIVAPSSRVTTFPSATAGDERGPLCPEAGPPTVTEFEYLSVQIGLPSAAARHWR